VAAIDAHERPQQPNKAVLLIEKRAESMVLPAIPPEPRHPGVALCECCSKKDGFPSPLELPAFT